ncbi:MAG: hypothetical protein ACYC45_01885 [Acidithiobacillus ferriphilus]|jgi:hypothetical protein|uniref:hypothetical protein n=1 Tax=Acidithiobacillus ferriphilus TaxID=1689834 RepID=UPI001C062ABD|nr:hypothetical protein [Acidithiobacillus ferriphilus]MBU2785839.1 hypothetical protein [Acidithiobacillus ferriphilus]MBU2827146.1 hypothetical protein [Acidithiobacillus ferriphilus]MBU2844918.1 hypothetical protein [Acidithiobacillus ferriphilus]MEB8476007.1 hypothetical protein [Acidithiobacillus ferriphilus]MEB8536676.1 hypothetical protein [Acidithiobacillus ferriphilus]
MNAVIQSPAHPLVCAGAEHIFIVHALLDRLSAHTGLTFRISPQHQSFFFRARFGAVSF